METETTEWSEFLNWRKSTAKQVLECENLGANSTELCYEHDSQQL